VAKLSLLLNCLRVGENNCPPPRLKFIMNSIKTAYVPMNPQRAISATRGWEYFAKDDVELFFQEFCYETHRLIQKRWGSAKKFLF